MRRRGIFAVVAAALLALASAKQPLSRTAPVRPARDLKGGDEATALSRPGRVAAAAAATTTHRGGAVKGLAKRVEVGAFFGLWYALNVWYNIENKKVLKLVDLPWLVSVFQLGVGALYSLGAWATFRAPPPHLAAAIQAASRIALAHGAGQAATVVSLGAGKVSATHVVKALEPFMSAVLSALIMGEVLPGPVYASLGLVIFGVAVAVAKDLTFSPLSFGAAMASNWMFAARAIFSKQAMVRRDLGLNNLSAPTLFGVVTLGATLMMLPLALVFEGSSVAGALAKCSVPPSTLSIRLVLSGLFHYLNNEVMFMTLSRVNPITLAVGNTVKRVVIILASLIVFGEPMAPIAALGASIGLFGTLLYSILKQCLS